FQGSGLPINQQMHTISEVNINIYKKIKYLDGKKTQKRIDCDLLILPALMFIPGRFCSQGFLMLPVFRIFGFSANQIHPEHESDRFIEYCTPTEKTSQNSCNQKSCAGKHTLEK
ncbi:MAG: hypothetical protein MI702_05925, partial [Chlorobiales bacterium]|nr:hypothetical protein [Chlorobiales bacterium]